MKIKFLVLVFILSLFQNSYAQVENETRFTHLSDTILEVPSTLKGTWQDMFNTKKSTLLIWGWVISSSVLLYVYDEKIYSNTQKLGRKLGLGNDDHTKSFLRINGVSLFQGPSDVGSSLYYIGNGWTQFGIASAFYLTGLSSDDTRAKKTGIQVMNSLFSASIPTQILKRATGREDPYRASSYRGTWRPFDKNYDKDISAHDAVPSGHLMAATSTFGVIDTNYPEYRNVIRPVGIGLLSLLSFQMVNIGVHWASDYPLALFLGYVSGRRAALNGMNLEKEVGHATSHWQIDPLFESDFVSNRSYGLSANYYF